MALLKKYYGFLFFLIMSVFSLIRVMTESPVSGHYRIFTGAARLLWQRQDPYEFDFKSVGYWFYSPSCGLFFYSLFAYLPDFLGLLIYSLLSIAAIFLILIFSLSYALNLPAKEVWKSKEFQFGLFWSANAVFLAVLAAKLEMLIIALLILSIITLIKTRSVWVEASCSLCLGMLLNWKLQPLPTIGLILIFITLGQKRIKPLIFLGIAVLFWNFAPAVVLGIDFLHQLNEHWHSSISSFVQTSYMNYDDFYRLLFAMGLPHTFSQAMVISAMIGALYGGVITYLVYRKESGRNITLLALSLGSAFMIALSPQNQNNGSILFLPILISATVLFFKSNSKSRWITATFLALFSFIYSNLFSSQLEEFFRSYAVKSVLILGYSAFLTQRAINASQQKNFS